jgi:hypothetical protein
MELITILNRCHRFRGFVYQHARFSPDNKSIEVEPNASQQLLEAIENGQERWLSADNKRIGFLRAGRTGANADTHLTAFLMDAQRAARDIARLPGTTPGQMAAAMEELENNIHEHSESPETGLLAYRAAQGAFEFVACDAGIGLLGSLARCPAYAGLSDHGAALELALTDGASRFGSGSNRGHGFRPIFVGLVNQQGSLRFRAGDQALLMDGTSPTLASSHLAQKPPIQGFFVSVLCRTPA